MNQLLTRVNPSKGHVSTLSCLYTTQKTKKRKQFSDGFIKLNSTTGHCQLFRAKDNYISFNEGILESINVNPPQVRQIMGGEYTEIVFEGYFVTVEKQIEHTQPVVKHLPVFKMPRFQPLVQVTAPRQQTENPKTHSDRPNQNISTFNGKGKKGVYNVNTEELDDIWGENDSSNNNTNDVNPDQRSVDDSDYDGNYMDSNNITQISQHSKVPVRPSNQFEIQYNGSYDNFKKPIPDIATHARNQLNRPTSWFDGDAISNSNVESESKYEFGHSAMGGINKRQRTVSFDNDQNSLYDNDKENSESFIPYPNNEQGVRSSWVEDYDEDTYVKNDRNNIQRQTMPSHKNNTNNNEVKQSKTQYSSHINNNNDQTVYDNNDVWGSWQEEDIIPSTSLIGAHQNVSNIIQFNNTSNVMYNKEEDEDGNDNVNSLSMRMNQPRYDMSATTPIKYELHESSSQIIHSHYQHSNDITQNNATLSVAIETTSSNTNNIWDF